MEKCKVIEAKIDVLKQILTIWSYFILGWGGGLGTLLFKGNANLGLISLTSLGLVFSIIVGIFILIALFREIAKLETCKEE
ncbi:MAG: hypothetical protein DSZ31_06500 [Gammaproteobacteria bacterium]|nr:MAG: hypothetical protein DSZ31_06500 [Gammaproteobacteria bacterium]RTZ70388.1 MAG: hypothetical protein DSZ30_00905 [Aquificaceae bacterium]